MKEVHAHATTAHKPHMRPHRPNLRGWSHHSSPEAIKAAAEAAPVSRRVFRVTAECTDITKESSFDACKPILALRQEMAQAIRRRELSAVLPGLKAELDGLARPEQASATEMTAADVWGWLMGLAVMLVATFGSVIFAVPLMSGANRPNRPNDPPGHPTCSQSARWTVSRPTCWLTYRENSRKVAAFRATSHWSLRSAASARR